MQKEAPAKAAPASPAKKASVPVSSKEILAKANAKANAKVRCLKFIHFTVHSPFHTGREGCQEEGELKRREFRGVL